MKIIGITGGIACGKSETATYLRQKGFQVIDCDQINRNLQQNDKEVLEKIKAQFPDVFDNAVLNRKKLSQRAFLNLGNLKKIEQIMMEPIKKEIFARIDFYKQAGEKIIFIDAPLLFESGLDKICHQVICIHTTLELQKERFLKREGMNEKIFEHIQQTQWPLSQKMQRADILILSDTLNHLQAQIDKVLGALLPVNNQTGFFAGSFDPFTKGHLYLLCQAVLRCEKVYIGVGTNPLKKQALSTQERIDCIQGALDDFMAEKTTPVHETNSEMFEKARQKIAANPNMIQIVSYDGLTVDAAIQAKASVLLRGARNNMDQVFETQLNAMNQALLTVRQTTMENIILEAPQNLISVSSSAVRQLFAFQEYIAVRAFVSPSVYICLLKKYLFEPFEAMCRPYQPTPDAIRQAYNLWLNNSTQNELIETAAYLNRLKITALHNPDLITQANIDQNILTIAAFYHKNSALFPFQNSLDLTAAAAFLNQTF